ncbi:MAG: hypothetical protein IJS30_05860 [Bacteroidales bacterium]|nr:hypothetical protein [Bacteroidales bacterium]
MTLSVKVCYNIGKEASLRCGGTYLKETVGARALDIDGLCPNPPLRLCYYTSCPAQPSLSPDGENKSIANGSFWR